MNKNALDLFCNPHSAFGKLYAPCALRDVEVEHASHCIS